MKKAPLVLALLAIALCGLTACNTAEGFGRDLESAGKAIDDAID